jgi:hypothetical protein
MKPMDTYLKIVMKLTFYAYLLKKSLLLNYMISPQQITILT